MRHTKVCILLYCRPTDHARLRWVADKILYPTIVISAFVICGNMWQALYRRHSFVFIFIRYKTFHFDARNFKKILANLKQNFKYLKSICIPTLFCINLNLVYTISMKLVTICMFSLLSVGCSSKLLTDCVCLVCRVR